MNYLEMKDTIKEFTNESYKEFIKALISVEKGIEDDGALDKIYDAFMEDDTMNLLHEDFDYLIDELREQGEIEEVMNMEEEKDDLVNIVGNIVEKPELVERENKDGEKFQVANFSVVSKDKEGNKVYTNCSAYGDKADIPKEFNKGDFVKLFGQNRTSIDNEGKEHTNVRILSSKLLKAREKNKEKEEKEEKKESVLGAIKKYKEEEKVIPKDRTGTVKENER